VESKKKFDRGSAPATEYRNPKGEVVKIDPKDRKIQELRSELSEEKWRNRELRHRTFYSTYYSRPVVIYHDPYPSVFWWWLLDRSIEQQALWAYHHRASMDAARYNELLGRNAELRARVAALEAQKVPVDPTFKPAGMTDRDMMYDDNFVNAVYNPAPKPRPVQVYHGPSATTVLKWLGIVALSLLILCLLVWLIFVKKWGNDND